MRTTIDMPDGLYRKTKAVAALRGTSMKELIIHAVDHEVNHRETAESKKRRKADLPIIKSWKGPKLDLTNFDFDDLLG